MAKPNIILIVLDTVRASSLSCYGYSRETTPNIDRIASEGVLYKNAISASPWTLPSHASMFTGMFPSKHGAHERHKYLDNRYGTLAELLESYGYETVGISNNSWVSKQFGLDRGFKRFIKVWQVFQAETDFAGLREDSPTILEEFGRVLGLAWRGNIFKNLLNGIYGRFIYRGYDYGARRINKEMKKWVIKYYKDSETATTPRSNSIEEVNDSHQKSKKPFFMFINYLEAHLKYQPPGKYGIMYLPEGVSRREASKVNQNAWSYMAGLKKMDERDFEILRALYDGELSYLDFRINEVYAFLKEQNLLDNTVLIITSDHGENIGEHNKMDHQYCLYDTLLKVPLIIRFPDVFPSGQIIEDQVQTVDIFPTIMDLLGIDDEDIKTEIQGETLIPEKLEYRKRKFAVTEYLGPQPSMESLKKRFPGTNSIYKYDRGLKAIRTQEYKYIKATDGRDELYNLGEDLTETNNIILSQREKASELKQLLESWDESFEKSSDERPIAVDKATLKRLEDLGYL